MDKVEWAERLPDGGVRLLVGIADVDSHVPQWPPLDAYATRSTTSVHTGIVTFPMLPEQLSRDTTSLNPDAARLAVIVDMTVDHEGVITQSAIYRAWLCNKAKDDGNGAFYKSCHCTGKSRGDFHVLRILTSTVLWRYITDK